MDKDELIMVCEAFKVYFKDDSLKLLRKLNIDTSSFMQIESLAEDVEAPGFRFSQHVSLIESILVERLNEKNLDIFDYLSHAYYKLINEGSKAWALSSPEIQTFINETIEIVRNYISLAITTPELFDNAIFDLKTNIYSTVPSVNFEGFEKVKRFMQLSSLVADLSIIDTIIENLNNDGIKVCHLMSYLIAQELKRHMIYNPELDDIINLCKLYLQNKTFKRYIIDNCRTNNLSKGIEVETNTFLGVLLTKNLIPQTKDPKLAEFETRVFDKLMSCRTQNAYNKTMEVF